jgi:hypothetical protein
MPDQMRPCRACDALSRRAAEEPDGLCTVHAGFARGGYIASPNFSTLVSHEEANRLATREMRGILDADPESLYRLLANEITPWLTNFGRAVVHTDNLSSFYQRDPRLRSAVTLMEWVEQFATFAQVEADWGFNCVVFTPRASSESDPPAA